MVASKGMYLSNQWPEEPLDPLVLGVQGSCIPGHPIGKSARHEVSITHQCTWRYIHLHASSPAFFLLTV